MFLKNVSDYIRGLYLDFIVCLMMLYVKILIIYFRFVEGQWLKYYLSLNVDHDTVMRKIKTNNNCPISIEDLYEKYYREYAVYYKS